MKLIRFGQAGEEKPGIILENGKRVDVSAFGEDYDEKFFGTKGIERLSEWLKGEDNLPEVPDSERLGAAVCRPSKIVCIGLNYAKHAEESGMEVPREPIVF